jgi:hypothetical protein
LQQEVRAVEHESTAFTAHRESETSKLDHERTTAAQRRGGDREKA